MEGLTQYPPAPLNKQDAIWRHRNSLGPCQDILLFFFFFFIFFSLSILDQRRRRRRRRRFRSLSSGRKELVAASCCEAWLLEQDGTVGTNDWKFLYKKKKKKCTAPCKLSFLFVPIEGGLHRLAGSSFELLRLKKNSRFLSQPLWFLPSLRSHRCLRSGKRRLLSQTAKFMPHCTRPHPQPSTPGGTGKKTTGVKKKWG